MGYNHIPLIKGGIKILDLKAQTFALLAKNVNLRS
jgi:hypothetical protein